ncbi:MAG: hypothetical protein CSA26_03290 [Desulfobacterales bacterium]|nr:MAG: hypothetical protein CSA26_03290 [Desulfobacterales bacterium]
MEITDNMMAATNTVHHTPLAQTEPLHQYMTVPSVSPVTSSYISPEVVSAGMMGLIVVGTGTMGANLHKVQEGKMTIGEAATDSLVKGAAGGVAAASATAASTTLTGGGLMGLGVTLAVATGVSYLLSR